MWFFSATVHRELIKLGGDQSQEKTYLLKVKVHPPPTKSWRSLRPALPSRDRDRDRATPQNFLLPCTRLGHWCAGWSSCTLMFHASPGAVIKFWAPRLCARGMSWNAVGFSGRHLRFAASLLCHQNLLPMGCYEVPAEHSWKLQLGASGGSSG